ncbi:hypothetical protein EG351_07990 [Chryseobacterium bernardetii]|nr:hypothetical protein EG351_07990 [Chryseobacterium bernardetii]
MNDVYWYKDKKSCNLHHQENPWNFIRKNTVAQTKKPCKKTYRTFADLTIILFNVFKFKVQW